MVAVGKVIGQKICTIKYDLKAAVYYTPCTRSCRDTAQKCHINEINRTEPVVRSLLHKHVAILHSQTCEIKIEHPLL